MFDVIGRRRRALPACAVLLLGSIGMFQRNVSPAPTFYRDVLPILQERCQTCHRPGQIGPMPLQTYAQARAKGAAIQQMVRLRRMPPWFADSRFGQFANDPSLTGAQIQTISAWVDEGAPAGNPDEAPAPRRWVNGWNIPQPDSIVQMPIPVTIPEKGDVEYTYTIVPTGFTEDKWVRMSELRPTDRAHVHHAVVYVRPPGSSWLRNAPINKPFVASSVADSLSQHEAQWSDIDLLLVYAPGSSPDEWPNGMAKLVPAGSDFVFQMHYNTNGHSGSDQTSIGLVFAKQLPTQRVLTLQLTNGHFSIPPGEDNYPVEASGTLPHDSTLLSFFPHMHVRGKQFDYNIVDERGSIEPLLRVNYDFYWQLSYRLATPRLLKAGTKLEAIGWYDNSSKNPHNPDPTATVTWGDQTYNEMMVGFFDVAVPRETDKAQFFKRP